MTRSPLTRQYLKQGVTQFYTITNYYPPYARPIIQFQPIQISDLRREAHHIDTALYSRLIAGLLQLSGISCLIENIHKTVERLLIYNQDPDAKINSVFPYGTILAIKQPYCEMIQETHSCIQVDHVSDLIALLPGDDQIPEHFRIKATSPEKSDMEWKREGNKSMEGEDYHHAIDW